MKMEIYKNAKKRVRQKTHSFYANITTHYFAKLLQKLAFFLILGE